ncbi:type I-PGING CRISPR-associated protein Cas5p [Prevotella sp. A2931]|uniref:Type I-PGING CRISPR-associated protein Cas5p n=1 Tax=Prevotella illustrans TaxID=2800387 RepID=A0ABS3M8G4_9BACT|nr:MULTISPECIES: type I-PGING CRISPR-associated protein Cas5p [Prevotella]MBO1364472.1 type I-PGING CRISPR-associated protein Cas5p [Prevotella illustrans]PTL26257.1 type I-PGING CRISPR-associated protein Cas5p [Prevotella sp. oral taxon 820]
MQTNLDLSLLKELPELSAKVTLEIRPLAPLSMVSEMPGSYYKSMKYPDKKMICGLFENILDWHIDLPLRKNIFKEYKAIRKKQKIEVDDYVSGSTYQPLLMDYFSINGKPKVKFESLCFYKDLWNRCYRRSDSYKHINGCRNVDIDILAEKSKLFSMWEKVVEEKKLSSKDADKERNKWFSDNMGAIPCFYTSPTSREFIAINGIFEISLLIDIHLRDLLFQNINSNNLGYLGTSEGWVDIKLK